MNLFTTADRRPVHFVGIGGAGMSALALIASRRGLVVSGCDTDTSGAADLAALGVPVLGQSVLLRGVNDSADALEALFRAMIAHRVKPYYLHQLDAAPGTARFHVPIREGQALLDSLRGRVTGLAWPTYVLDIPGGRGKVPIGPDYLRPDGTVRAPKAVIGDAGDAAPAPIPGFDATIG